MNIYEQLSYSKMKENIQANERNKFKQEIKFAIGWDLENIKYLCKTKNEIKIFEEFMKVLEKISNIN